MKESSLPQPVAEVTSQISTNPVDKTVLENDHMYAKLFPYYDIEGSKAENSEIKQRLQFIWDYFSKGEQDDNSVLWKIRQMENMLGSPEFGTTKYEQLYRYLKIRGQEDALKSQREQMERASIDKLEGGRNEI